MAVSVALPARRPPFSCFVFFASLTHQRRERRAVVGDRRRRRLDRVFELVQPGADDRLAQRGEALHVERDVVVDDEQGPGAAITAVADVVEDAVEVVGVEVAAAHLDDRAEAAVERAAA